MLRKLLLVAVLVALPATSHAQGVQVSGFGPRLGLGIDPDQLVLGGQLAVTGFAPDWSFDPSLELGFGDDLTVIAFNFDAKYHFTLRDSDWRPQLGGGLGLNSISVDVPGRGDDSDTEVGLNVILGVGVPTRAGNTFFGELRLGVGDIPEIRLMAGVNFRP